GRVKIQVVTPAGKEAILAFIEEGELFGELAVLDREPRNEFAVAVPWARVVDVPRVDMLWLMGQRADILLAGIKLPRFPRRLLDKLIVARRRQNIVLDRGRLAAEAAGNLVPSIRPLRGLASETER